MRNISGKPRVGYVNPKEATGMNSKDATQVSAPVSLAAKPSVSSEDYPTPHDSDDLADGKTGGNFQSP
jgi:hypothetical protein